MKDVAKLVGLHDVASDCCGGVVDMWRGIKRIMPSSRIFEAVDQYDDVRKRTGQKFLGIGVVDMS